jgi:hypothetical protein
MVTSSHEAAHRIFQDRPELLTPVFGVLGIPLPAKTSVEVLDGDTTEIRPLERRVDSLLRVETSDGERFLLVIEAQSRKDPGKETSWPYYTAFLRDKYHLPVLLLVVCKDRATAKWATGPFTTGYRTWVLQSTHPMVLGPDNLPLITNAAEAGRNLAMSALAALTHSRDKNCEAILEALASAVGSAEATSTQYFGELMDIGLGDTPARTIWRNLMAVGSYFPGRGTLVEENFLAGQAEGRAEGRAEGKAEGRASSVLGVLEARGITVRDDQRDRISECTDLDVLDRWLKRALTLTDTDELFSDDTPADA